ncbi:MAG TPA: HAD-IIIA family hydrolase [Gemmataceae bacterium]
MVVLWALKLGDLLGALPAFRALRKAWPKTELTLIGLPWAQTFVKRYCEYVDGIRVFPGYSGPPEREPNIDGIPVFLREMQAERFDLAIQMCCPARRGHRVEVLTRRDNLTLTPALKWPEGINIVHIRAGTSEHIPEERLLPLIEEFTLHALFGHQALCHPRSLYTWLRVSKAIESVYRSVVGYPSFRHALEVSEETFAIPFESRSNDGGRRAVFLDKDGTLIEDVLYNVDPQKVRLASGAVKGLATLHENGYALIVVSNQSGVTHGLFPERALGEVERSLRRQLGAFGVPLAGFSYCPHHPNGRVNRYAIMCRCRKPAPGMLRRAAADLGIDLAESWMVGDILDDKEAGRRAGCRTVLIDNGNETEWRGGRRRRPHFRAADIAESARLCFPAQPLIESIRTAMMAPMYTLAGCLNLTGLVALIGQTPLLITNNTGPEHIAAAVGTTFVDLYAQTNQQHTPWMTPHRFLYNDVPCEDCFKSGCPQGHHDCLVRVPPDAVVKAALELLPRLATIL